MGGLRERDTLQRVMPQRKVSIASYFVHGPENNLFLGGGQEETQLRWLPRKEKIIFLVNQNAYAFVFE